MFDWLIIAMGVHYGVPSEDHLREAAGFRFEAGSKVVQLYYEHDLERKLDFTGQPMGDVQVSEWGALIRMPINEHWSLNAGFGSVDTDLDQNPVVVNEVVRNRLTKAHRPLNAPGGVSYKLDPGYAISVGAEYRKKHLTVYGRYTWSRVQEELNWHTGAPCGTFPVDPGCVDWLQENQDLDFGTFKLGLKWTFLE